MVYELAAAQAGAGAYVEIWALKSDSENDHPSEEPVPIRYFEASQFLGSRWSRELIDALGKIANELDIIHAHNTYELLNLQVGRFARRHRIPVFFHPHGALDPKLFSGLSFGSMKKRIYNAIFEIPNLNDSAGVFALTALELEQLRSLGMRAPVHQVPNGVSIAASLPGREISREFYGIQKDDFVLLYVGRINPKKRIEDILEAVAAARVIEPRVRLLIAGSREQELAYVRRLDQIILDLSLKSTVQWLGFLDEQEKPSVFAAADAFIHASESEGMAMAILEALSFGVPTIVSVGCYMSAAAEFGAVLQTGQGARELGDGLKKLVVDDNLRTGFRSASLQYVQQQHDWKEIARKILDVYATNS